MANTYFAREKYCYFVDGDWIAPPDRSKECGLREFTIRKWNSGETYKEYAKAELGFSDVASLILRTMDANGGLKAAILGFGGDGCYSAYIVDSTAKIGEHYDLVFQGRVWLDVYDDTSLVAKFRGDAIRVYRAGAFGCIIQVIDIE